MTTFDDQLPSDRQRIVVHLRTNDDREKRIEGTWRMKPEPHFLRGGVTPFAVFGRDSWEHVWEAPS